MYLKRSLSESSKSSFPTPSLTCGKLNTVKQQSFIFLIYVVHGQTRKEQWVQLGRPFSENLDLRSAAHRAFTVQTFSKINDFYGDLSWSARLPDLWVWNFHLWGYFKRRAFQTSPADLHKTKLSIWREEFHNSCHFHVLGIVMNSSSVHQSCWMTPEGCFLKINFFVIFINNVKQVSSNSDYFEYIFNELLSNCLSVTILNECCCTIYCTYYVINMGI
jgi:hypothetical protein